MIVDKIFLKFIAVGIINTLVGTSIMFGLYNLAGFGYWQSSSVNYMVTSILSFILNKYFTFQIKAWSFLQIAGFAAIIAFSYLIAYTAAKPAVYYLMQNRNQKISGNVSLFVGMCLFTGINYTGQRFFVFRRKTKNEP